MTDGQSSVQMLPVALGPLPGERLAGLCLRNDEANGWPADSVARLISRYIGGGIGFAFPGQGVLATTQRLDVLAGHLGCSTEAIEATTLIHPMRRLFGPEVSPRRLGAVGNLRICPQCIAERRYLGLDTILPLVVSCIEHRVRLAERCSLGHLLGRPRIDAEPFTCTTCGESWAKIKTRVLDGPTLLAQRRTVHAYRVILERGDRDLITRSRKLLGKKTPLRWQGPWATRNYVAGYPILVAHIYSLTSVVATFVATEVPPERLFDEASPARGPSIVCLNEACLMHGRSESVHANGRRAGIVESYCAECGSRFLGDRIISSFDLDNGSASLSPRAVLRSRSRLARFQARVAAAIDVMVTEGSEPKVASVLGRAGVPMAAQMRARRLGIRTVIGIRLGLSPPDVVAGNVIDASQRWRFPWAEVRGQRCKSRGPGTPKRACHDGAPGPIRRVG